MRAIFLDRDGVVCENRADHVKCWEEFRFIPGTFPALWRLRKAGFLVFVVTNQAIVNRGVVPAAVIEDIHTRMLAQIKHYGGGIDEIRYCPHETSERCACRKPMPGMLTQLAAKWRVNLSCSYMIGDAWTDMVSGHAAGCRTIMVRTGRGAEQLQHPETNQHLVNHIAANLLESVDWIFAQEGLTFSQPDSLTQARYAVDKYREAPVTAGS